MIDGQKMNGIATGVIGGTIPGVIMAVVYLLTTEKRLTRIETNIEWMKKDIKGCQPTSEDHTI
jgi:hypothetical protein